MSNEFDEQIKECLLKERVMIPGGTERKILSTLENLPEKKKRSPGRLLAASMLAVGAAVFLTINIQTLADNIPILNSIQKHFQLDNGYEKVMEESTLSKESNGTNITITNTVFDGVELLVSYKVEGKTAFVTKPTLFSDSTSINGESEGLVEARDEYGEFQDKAHKIYEGVTRFTVTSGSLDRKVRNANQPETIDVAKLPDQFTLQLHIDKLGGPDGNISGKWAFDLPIVTQKAKNFVKELTLNKDLSSLFPDTKLEKVVVTPMRIYLQGIVDEKYSNLDYIVVDNDGETRKWLGGQAREYTTGKMASQSYFENAGSVPKSITVIPYRLDKLHSGFVMKSSVRLNKEGTTTVPLNQDKNLTITKVFEKDGKTYLYYISDYPVNDYLPILLVDEDGIMHNRVLNESIKSPKGKESVLVFNESLLNKELKVFNPNTVYYDQAFTIEIK